MKTSVVKLMTLGFKLNGITSASERLGQPSVFVKRRLIARVKDMLLSH
jgi:hypothetical protein